MGASDCSEVKALCGVMHVSIHMRLGFPRILCLAPPLAFLFDSRLRDMGEAWNPLGKTPQGLQPNPLIAPVPFNGSRLLLRITRRAIREGSISAGIGTGCE